MSEIYSIAIDGPAGAGKSTIAKEIARRLGIVYVDTGAMYRAIALYFVRGGISPEDETAVKNACGEVDVAIEYREGNQQVLLNGENVTGLIRAEEVGRMASSVSRHLPVREKLTKLQRDLAAKTSVVMDGRDIGTFVLPGAEIKIYLTASSAVRARRRFLELTDKGVMCNLEEIEQDIIERDERDMNREHSPLQKAPDAVLLDTSAMDIGQAAEAVIRIVRERGTAKWK